jgi:hypothetical protein
MDSVRQTGRMSDAARLDAKFILDALRKFARANGIPENLAIDVYDRERKWLTERAKVQAFVGILAERRAKDALRRRKY